MTIEDRDDDIIDLGAASATTQGIGEMGLEADGFVRPPHGLTDE